MQGQNSVKDTAHRAGRRGRLRVRTAREKDAGAIRVVAWRTWFHTYRDEIAETAITDVVEKSYTRAAVLRTLKTQGTFVHVAELDDSVVGFVTHRNASGAVHEVDAIYVDPAFHGRGAGWALWRTVLETARDSGRTEIQLSVLEQNRIGRTWYDRQGGAIVGRRVLTLSDGPHLELRYRFELGSVDAPTPGRAVTRTIRAIASFVYSKLP